MKIADFISLIHSMPVDHHAFTIKKSIWKSINQQKIIDSIFMDKEQVTINRKELRESSNDLPLFIIKTLMWGYPTMGRGTNISKILDPSTFDRLVKNLSEIKGKNITLKQLVDIGGGINGVGIATLSKFANFLNTQIEGRSALIMDSHIIQTLNLGVFDELSRLKKISTHNVYNRYSDYLSKVDEISDNLGVHPESIEMFLFIFGRKLSPVLKNSGGDSKHDLGGETTVRLLSERDAYRFSLINAYKTLLDINDELFTSMINLAMSGELRDIDQAFEVGESFDFQLEHIKGTNDINLNKLISHYELIEDLLESLANVNGINEEDLI